MSRVVSFALLVPAFVLASVLQPVTVLPEEDGSIEYSERVTRVENGPAGAGIALVGVMDTIGGTTFDWQFNGPSQRLLAYSDEGMHVAWMYSAANQTAHPDRNMRYNFFDYSLGEWNWIDSDFMQSGVNVFTERTGFGNLDVDPATGVAMIASHVGSPLTPVMARDMSPGIGLFEYCNGAPNAVGYQWPVIGVTGNSSVQMAMIDVATTHALYYTKVEPWCQFSVPIPVASPQPNPLFDNHNIAASKVSNKVAITWVNTPEGATSPRPAFLRTSDNGGASWANPTEIPIPPSAYGRDTLASFHISSLFPFYDRNDELHLVTSIMPYVGSDGFVIPAQIWHWNASNSPAWNRITTATDPNLQAPVGYNALYATRPTIGSDASGNLFVAWEQFDGQNVEPGPPEYVRADIFYSHSGNNGLTWVAPTKLTNAGTASIRFPSVIDFIGDEVAVAYVVDRQAGFPIFGQGPITNNPVVVQRWPNPYGTGAAERPEQSPLGLVASARPNPFRRGTSISYSVPRAGNVSLSVYDAAGRSVRSLVSGSAQPGRYSAGWDGRDNQGNSVAAGVYLYRLTFDQETVSGKLLLTD